MAQSTAHKALASLQHKFQTKIREVGALKKLISEGNNADIEVQRLRAINAELTDDLLASDKELKLSQFAAQYADGAYKRLQAHVKDIEGLLKDAKESASSLKGFTVIAFVLGASVGVLGALAYVQQVGL